eukprot:474437_1
MSMLNRESLWLTCGQKLLHSETNPIVLYLCKIILFDIRNRIHVRLSISFQAGFLLHLASIVIDWIVFFMEYIVLICDVVATKNMTFLQIVGNHLQNILLGPLANPGNRIVSFIIGLYVLFWRFVLPVLSFTLISLISMQSIGLQAQFRLNQLTKMILEFESNVLESKQQTIQHRLQDNMRRLNAQQLKILLHAFDQFDETFPRGIIGMIHEYIIVDEFSELVDSNESLKKLREFQNMNLEFVIL